ncbi:MAG: hypothetical protein EA404_01120 [Spirochaetaceae bacterium]|nr:MAG: hypothetical protein EA404_01120 [Spirochaetaceae bacterium]
MKPHAVRRALLAILLPLAFRLAPLPADQPRYLDQLVPSMLSSADLGYAAPLVPTSVAVRPNGNIILGTAVAAVELDRDYHEIDKPGRQLFTDDRINYAYEVTVTEAGTLFARAATGGNVFVIRPDLPRHQRIHTGIDIAAAFVASADGSLVVADATQRRAVRVQGRSVEPIDIFAGEYSWVQVATAGPGTTVWVWDAITSSIGVYTTSGVELERIQPQIEERERGAVRSIRTLPNGDFILLSTFALYRFDRNGTLQWRADSMPAPAAGGFNEIHSMALDPARGYIYLVSLTGQRVIRLIDVTQPAERTLLERRLLELNAQITAAPDDATLQIQKAQLYRDAGALALEAQAWRSVLDIDVFNQQAEDALAAAEGQLMLAQADRSGRRTLQLAQDVGPESARAIHSITLQLYEQAIARLRALPEQQRLARQELEALRSEFERLSRPQPQPRPPRLETAGATDVFPALIRHYREHPLGSVSVTNQQDRPIEHLTLTAGMRYADPAPASAPLARLNPGETAVLPLHVLLSPEALTVQEDIPVAMQIELHYSVDGRQQTATTTQVVTLRRNTSLYWDDSGKLASFITPNDQIVSDFALHAARSAADHASPLLSARAARAAAIADALGAFGIDYIEDPDSPFTEVFGNPGRIDTVRFPRTTLRLGVGDCDETASLLASLLEAAGIRTAIMTSPGHVFVAFDTEEPLNNRWLYEAADRTVIEYHGTLWIPLETTILQQGFLAAWTEGSRLVQMHADAVEFLPYYRERERYPSIPLPPASFAIEPPGADRLRAAYQLTRDQLRDALYLEVLAATESALERAAGHGQTTADPRRVARLHNQTGVLHARAGELGAAEAGFRRALAAQPDSAAPHINLANLHLLRRNHRRALEYAETAQQLRPRSAAVQLIRAQALHALGEHQRAADAIESLRELSAELAARYAYLARADQTLRASGGESEPVSVWELD